ncbi:MAG: hypothetical protein J5969_05080 [Lachnospiraceae bacterium]|nr:hypothetical protein [Lachnospiraceae bacterium]
METAELIERLMRLAAGDPVLRETLIKAGGQENPVGTFCRAAREAGVELYEMDLIAYGEESHAAMKRSTNGGGENTPSLEFEDDYFEILMTELEMMR